MIDIDGTPTILYTGVRLRSNPECGPLPPAECDLNLPFIESQLVAVADQGESVSGAFLLCLQLFAVFDLRGSQVCFGCKALAKAR